MLFNNVTGTKYENLDEFEKFKNFYIIVFQKKLSRYNPKFTFFSKEDNEFFDMEIKLDSFVNTIKIKFRKSPTKTDLNRINSMYKEINIYNNYRIIDTEDDNTIDLYVHMEEGYNDKLDLSTFDIIPSFEEKFNLDNFYDNTHKYQFFGSRIFQSFIEEYPVDYFIYYNSNMQVNENQIYKYSNDLRVLLRRHFAKLTRKFTFILGSGVSKAYGIPMWNQLLDNYLAGIKKTKPYNEGYIFEKIGDTSLIKAQFIVDNFSYASSRAGREYAFCRDLKKEFYSKSKFVPLGKSSLRSVVMCIDRHILRSDGVITYNYDDLFERTLEVETRLSYQTIFKDDDIENKDVNVYHVHGYLPRKGNLKSEHSNSIILSEEKYNYLFNNPLTWQISNQLTRFRENLCVLVGLSISDPSLRRLLENVKMSNPTRFHYAIIAKESKDYTPSIEDILAVTKHFERIGIHIIWVDKHSDIPKIIDSL